MKHFLFLTFLVFVMAFAAVPVHAAALVLKGKGGEIVTIESAPDLGKNAHLIKIEGAGSAWDGKPFLVNKDVVREYDRYGFEYTIELSSGLITRPYGLLVETEGTLVNGTIVDTYELYLPKQESPVELSHDLALSDGYAKGSLAQAYKEAPYKPVMD